MRTEQREIRKGHQIGHDDLVGGTYLLQGRLDVLGGFSSSQHDVGCEHLPNFGLRKMHELGVRRRVQEVRELESRLGRDGPEGTQPAPSPACGPPNHSLPLGVSSCDHLVLRREAEAETRDAPYHSDMGNFQSGKVALSFALRNPDGGLPQVGRYVDQVTETGSPLNSRMRAVRGGSSEPSHEKILQLR